MMIWTIRIAALALGCFFVGGCASDLGGLDELRRTNSAQDLALYQDMKSGVTSAITLPQACERALDKNLEIWLSRQEVAIQAEIRTGSLLKLLPQLNLGVTSDGRDAYAASSSLGLFTNQAAQLSQYSYSSTREHTTFNYGPLWNIMDFGVSYLRHQQEQKRSVIAAQELRRTRQRIVLETTQAWYRCLVTARIADRASAVKEGIDQQLANIATQLAHGQLSDTAAINARFPLKSELKNINQRLEDAQNAKLELARLMGVPFTADLNVADAALEPDAFTVNVETLEKQALVSRPELFEEDMNERISYDEARLTFLQMLPTPTMVFRGQADDNPMLYYNSWFNWGMDVSWNLFAIPAKVKEAHAHRLRAEFVRRKRMALIVAIFTQLQMALIEQEYALAEYRLAQDVSADCDKIVENLIAAEKTGKANKAAIVGKQILQLDKYADSLQTFARVMTARARIDNAIGADPDRCAGAAATGSTQGFTKAQRSAVDARHGLFSLQSGYAISATDSGERQIPERLPAGAAPVLPLPPSAAGPAGERPVDARGNPPSDDLPSEVQP